MNSLHTTAGGGLRAVWRRHVRSWWGDFRWPVTCLLALAALVLGFVGFRQRFEAQGEPRSALDVLYVSLQLFTMKSGAVEPPIGWALNVARWLAPLVAAYAALRALVTVFREHVRLFRLRFLKDHVVICGLGPKALELARCLRESSCSRAVVMIAPAATNEEVAACQAEGATLVVGDPSEAATLARARLTWARQLVALCPEDSTNVAIVVQARKLMADSRTDGVEHLKCFAHLSDVGLRSSLQRGKLFGDDPRCELSFFDLFDAAARRLLLESGQLPLDHGGIVEQDGRQVHLVILGFGRMGQSVALRAAQLGHFANRKPLRISVIDREAGRHKQALLFRYPAFLQVCSIEFHELEVETEHARQKIESWCAERQSATSMAVCFDRDSLALEVALRLLPKLWELDVPIAVRMSREAGFASLLKEGAARDDVRFYVRGFGMIEDRCTADMLEDLDNEDLARAIHEDFRTQQIKNGRDPNIDRSVFEWSRLDDDFKDSNRQQADHISIKLHAIGLECADAKDPREGVEQFEPHEIELLAEMEHNRWNAERLLAGWVYGKPADKARKISEYILPWAQLADNIKQYDRDAVKLIPALLKRISKKACRKAKQAP
ncbi:MAG: NAD-binding protein [Verrucomicrobiota bacterium]